ncbi:MAG: hypothetical protein WCI38_11300 [Chthoniobacterales bacterium]|jgi:hypothetical protein
MTKILELPDDLADKVRDIPDLDERIVRFIQAEAVLHARRQKRFSPQTLEFVEKARVAAERMKAEGFDRARIAEEVGEFLATLRA